MNKTLLEEMLEPYHELLEKYAELDRKYAELDGCIPMTTHSSQEDKKMKCMRTSEENHGY